METIKSWFASLSEREQKLVLAASAVGAIGIFYFIIWAPIHNALAQQKVALAKEQATYTWVQEQVNRAQALRQSNRSTSFNGSLTQLVNQTTRASGIPVSRMQPQDDELQVWIDEIPFNTLMQWLNNLEARGVIIVQSDISEVDAEGYVQVRRLQLGSL